MSSGPIGIRPRVPAPSTTRRARGTSRRPGFRSGPRFRDGQRGDQSPDRPWTTPRRRRPCGRAPLPPSTRSPWAAAPPKPKRSLPYRTVRRTPTGPRWRPRKTPSERSKPRPEIRAGWWKTVWSASAPVQEAPPSVRPRAQVLVTMARMGGPPPIALLGREGRGTGRQGHGAPAQCDQGWPDRRRWEAVAPPAPACRVVAEFRGRPGGRGARAELLAGVLENHPAHPPPRSEAAAPRSPLCR